jgi:hypothetical protein
MHFFMFTENHKNRLQSNKINQYKNTCRDVNYVYNTGNALRIKTYF